MLRLERKGEERAGRESEKNLSAIQDRALLAQLYVNSMQKPLLSK